MTDIPSIKTRKKMRQRYLDNIRAEGPGDMEGYKGADETDFGEPGQKKFIEEKGVIGPYSIARTKSGRAANIKGDKKDRVDEFREKIRHVSAKEDRAAKGVTPAMRKYYAERLGKEMGLSKKEVLEQLKMADEFNVKDKEIQSIDSEIRTYRKGKL